MLRSEDGGLTWSIALLEPLDRLDFVDRNLGWIVGGALTDQAILHTSDGGRHWTNQARNVVRSRPFFADIAMVDARRGVIVGSENGFVRPGEFHRGPPVVLFTDDGGGRWQRATLPASVGPRDIETPLQRVCVTPSGVGLTTGTDFATFERIIVLLTSDAGATWIDASDRLPTVAFAKVACAGDSHLWFGGVHMDGSTLLHSPDAGATWIDQTATLPPHLALAAITFVDPLVGWIVAVDHPLSSVRIVALQTTDGGEHWTEHVVAEGFGELTLEVDFRNAQQGVIVGQDLYFLPIPRSSFGLTFATMDGGDTWVENVLPEGINALSDVELPQ